MGELDFSAIGWGPPLAIDLKSAQLLLMAENAPSSSIINVFDTADVIEGIDQSLVSTLGSVHAEDATIEQAGQFIETGYVNTISLAPYEVFENLRVHEAEIVTNDKIAPQITNYSISDSLPNITVASDELLAGASEYHIENDLVGEFNVRLLLYRSENYEDRERMVRSSRLLIRRKTSRKPSVSQMRVLSWEMRTLLRLMVQLL